MSIEATTGQVRQNIALYSQAIQSGQTLDSEFYEIIRQQINSLPVKDQFHYATLLDRACACPDTPSAFKTNERAVETFDHIDRPRIGAYESMDAVIAEYDPEQPSLTKTGLQNLYPQFDFIRIKGDGHCQYRSIGTSLLYALAYMPYEQKQAKIEFLASQIDRLTGNQVDHPLQTMKEKVRSALEVSSPEFLNDVVYSDDLSDTIVHFLRILAAEEIQQNTPETLLGELDGKPLKQYYAEMVNMELAKLGGQFELYALSRCLGFTINCFDASIYNESTNYFVNSFGDYVAAKPSIDLLYRPGHYDLLISKRLRNQ